MTLTTSTNAEYHADRTALSNSKRELFRRNVRTFGRWINGEDVSTPPTDAMMLGSALDYYLLEPDLFVDRVGIEPEPKQCEQTTGKGEQCKNTAKPGSDFCGRHKGVSRFQDKEIVLPVDRYSLMLAMAEQVRAHEIAALLIDNTEHQKTCVWEDPEHDLLLKIRTDGFHRKHVFDLKTTNKTSYHGHRSTILEFGYHRQAAFYLRVLRGLGLVDDDVTWHWIVVSSTPDPLCWVYRAHPEDLELAERQVCEDLQAIRERLDSDNWQQDLATESVVRLPRYAHYED